MSSSLDKNKLQGSLLNLKQWESYQIKYEKPNASLCSWCRCSLSTTSSTSWWPCCWSSMWSGSHSSLPSLFRSKIYSWRTLYAYRNGWHCSFETLFLFSRCSVPTKTILRTLSAKNHSDKQRHCFYFPGALCRHRQHWGLCRQRTTPINKDIVFIFQVFCADKDNIEDVRSGSEAEVDSESDAPRKER